jgi:hypothetical protein
MKNNKYHTVGTIPKSNIKIAERFQTKQANKNIFYKVLFFSKNKIFDTVGTIPKSNIKIVERSKIDTPNT